MPYIDKQKKKEWYEKNKSLIIARNREYRRKNIEHYRKYNREYSKKWRLQNPEKARAKSIRCQAKRRANGKAKIEMDRFLARHPDYFKIKNREASRKRREICLTRYGGNPPKCICCGESHKEFLVIDHINGGGNKHRKIIYEAGCGHQIYLWIIRNKFPDGFRVLCDNCNSSRGRYGYCPHEKEK